MVEDVALRALKTGFFTLIERAGRFDAAAAYLGFSVSKLSEAASPNQPARYPRVDHVAQLERLVGEPLVTAQLARLGGYALVPEEAAPRAPAALLAHVLREAGELGGVTAEALADGKVCQAERDALAAALDELILRARNARAAVGGAALPIGKGA